MSEVNLFFRLSGYTGDVKPAKANKKQMNDVVLPEVMRYILGYMKSKPLF
jgi:hypothetical protein